MKNTVFLFCLMLILGLTNTAYADDCAVTRPSTTMGLELDHLEVILADQLARVYDECALDEELKKATEARAAPTGRMQNKNDPQGKFDKDMILNALIALHKQLIDPATGDIPLKAQIKRNLQLSIAELSEPGPVDTTELFPLNDWQRDNLLTIGAFNFNTYLADNGCSAVNIDSETLYEEFCKPTVHQLRKSLGYVGAIASVVTMIHQPSYKEYVGQLNLLANRWETYFDKTRSMYLWELVANRLRHNNSDRDEDDGFLPVPTNQLILFHPSLAFEYIDDLQDGNQFEESFVLEAIGFNRWKWKDNNSAETGLALGLSLIAAYSDRAGAEDLGWGLMAHINHTYSLGVTKHGGSTGVFFSVDLQKAVLEFKEKDKSGFWGLGAVKNQK